MLDHQSVLLLGVSSFCLVELGHEPVGNFVSLPRRRRHARRQRAVLLVRHPAQFLLVLRLSLDELFRGCFGGGGEVGFSLGHRGLVLVRLGLELGVLRVSRLVPGVHLRRRGCCGRCEGLGVPSLRGGDGLVVLASHFVDSGVQGRDGGGAVLLGGCLCRHESFGSDVLGVLQLILESLGLLRGGLLDQRDGRGGLLLSLVQLLAPQFFHCGSLIGELSFEPGGKICLDVVHLLAKVALQLLLLVRKHQLRRVQPGDAVGHGVVHRGEHANPRLGAFRVHQRLESSPLAGGGTGLGVKRLLQRGADGLDRRVPVLLDLRLEHLDLLVLCGLHRRERLVLRGFQLGDLFVVSGLKLSRLALPVRVEILLSLGDLRGEPGADDALQLGLLAGKVLVEGAAFRPRGSKLRANSRDDLVPLRRELCDQRLLLRLELSDRGLEFLRGSLVVLGEFRDGGFLGRHEGFGGDVLGVLKRLRVVRVEHLNLGLVRPSEVLDVLIVERPLLLDAVLVIRGDGFDGGGVLRLEQLHSFAPLVRHLHLSLGDGGLDGHFQLLRRVRPLILQEHLKRLALGGRGSHSRLHLELVLNLERLDRAVESRLTGGSFGGAGVGERLGVSSLRRGDAFLEVLLDPRGLGLPPLRVLVRQGQRRAVFGHLAVEYPPLSRVKTPRGSQRGGEPLALLVRLGLSLCDGLLQTADLGLERGDVRVVGVLHAGDLLGHSFLDVLERRGDARVLAQLLVFVAENHNLGFERLDALLVYPLKPSHLARLLALDLRQPRRLLLELLHHQLLQPLEHLESGLLPRRRPRRSRRRTHPLARGREHHVVGGDHHRLASRRLLRHRDRQPLAELLGEIPGDAHARGRRQRRRRARLGRLRALDDAHYG